MTPRDLALILYSALAEQESEVYLGDHNSNADRVFAIVDGDVDLTSVAEYILSKMESPE